MEQVHDRFLMQDSQYTFPYHHLPHRVGNANFAVSRHLSWGLEYLAYQEYIVELILRWRPRSVLEVGCGDGRLIGALAASVPICVGVDLSQRSIAFAKAFNPAVKFRCGNAGEIKESFDVVVAVEVLEHVPDRGLSKFISDLRARVRPGGRMILSVPTKVVPLHPKHYRHYTLRELTEQLTTAGVPTDELVSEYIFAEDWLLKFYRRAMFNRLWAIELPSLNRLIWAHAHRKCLRVGEKKGRHLIVSVQL